MLNHSLTIVLVESTRSIDVSWKRSVKRVEATTLKLGLDPEEPDAESASSKSPKKTSEGRCYESTSSLLAIVMGAGIACTHRKRSSHLRTIHLPTTASSRLE